MISAKRVRALLCDSLFHAEELTADGKPPAGAVLVEGIVGRFGFHPGRLAEHRDEIKAMLAELPDQFHEHGGGGWSFLNACTTRDGVLWTGEQRTMDDLFCLGLGVGLVQYALPRPYWSVLPGGMPYVIVLAEVRPVQVPASDSDASQGRQLAEGE